MLSTEEICRWTHILAIPIWKCQTLLKPGNMLVTTSSDMVVTTLSTCCNTVVRTVTKLSQGCQISVQGCDKLVNLSTSLTQGCHKDVHIVTTLLPGCSKLGISIHIIKLMCICIYVEQIHVWQSRVEIKYNSVAYFDHVSAFET